MERSQSFCTVAIELSEPLIVTDARLDERFKKLDIVRGPPHFRYYCGVPIRTDEGIAIGALCVLDYHPRQLSEATISALQLLARQVEAELAIRKALHELQQQHEADRQADAAKDQLASLVVHDLKGPLTGIVTHARLLLSAQMLEADDRESAQDIVNAAQQMNRLVMNLLDIRQAEDGALVLRRGDESIAALIKAASNTVATRLADRDQKLVIDATVDRWSVDRDLFRRVLENLIENAGKYSPTRSTITVRAQVVEDALEVRVEDQGSGVPDLDKPRVFEKYVRLDPAGAATAAASRGLGLVFCRLAAEAHGGKVWIEDRKPCGAAFCVRIPKGH